MAEYVANFELNNNEITTGFEVNNNTLELNGEIGRNQIQSDFEFNLGDKHFTYEQATPSNTWVITHNLNKKPSITVVDSAENVIVGAYEYNDLNTVTLTFNGAFTGKAYFN